MVTRLRDRREAGSWVPNFDLALVQVGLGNRNDALALLHESLREKEPWLVFLTVDPRLSSLRNGAEIHQPGEKDRPHGS